MYLSGTDGIIGGAPGAKIAPEKLALAVSEMFEQIPIDERTVHTHFNKERMRKKGMR